MSAPVDNVNQGIGEAPQSAATPNSTTIDVSDVKTIKVGNISRIVSSRDIREFFSFSGEIKYVEMQSETENTQLSYVTFNDAQGADTAILLSGATIGNLPVTIAPAKEYQLPPEALIPSSPLKKPAVTSSALEKAEDVVSTMAAKGYILGKDALSKAKAFDEQHNLTSKASATVVTIDQRIGLMEKISMGRAVVNEKVKQMDERFLVSEKTKSVFAVAEQTASSAGSAIMSNPYVISGASWVSNALGVFAKAAEDVTTKTKEKVVRAEEEKQETMIRQRTAIINDFAQNHLDEPSGNELPVVQTKSADDTNPGLV
ncbi:binding partner of ACD11 1 [Rosa sericea]